MISSIKRLRIFNSMTRRKEDFRPATGNVGVYVCGITPYDVTHLGHAFTYTFFDVAVRYLRYLGYTVTYVQNVTDIDDDILRKAKEVGKNWKELGEENTRKFLEDMGWLNNARPDVYPRATDHIPQMIAVIQKLQGKKVAYEKNGNVYFSVAKDKNYGTLSKLSKKAMLPIANARGNNPDDPNKKNPLDFVLWQAEKAADSFAKTEVNPFWPSPWGPGRPGWHIECSAMSMKYLGETFDIHGGGADLLFPHHESSLAQSEMATRAQGQSAQSLRGRARNPFVRYWMHTGMVRYGGEKMSKSLGNMVFIKDLKKRYSRNTIRIYLLSRHYRSIFEFDERDMGKAYETSALFDQMLTLLRRAEKVVKSRAKSAIDIRTYKKRFFEALNDDFDTPRAIGVLEDLANKIRQKPHGSVAGGGAFAVEAFVILGLT